jgi:hypothetical protein
MTFTHEFQPVPSEPQAGPRQEFIPAATGPAAEPLPFSPPSLARRAEQAEEVAPEPEAIELEVPEAARFEPAPTPPESTPFRGDWSSAPLGELGLVQLVQRLGATIERRREWLASEAVAAPAPLLAPAAGFDPAPAEEAAQAMAAYFGKPSCDQAPTPDAEDAPEEPHSAAPTPAAFGAHPNLLGSWPAAAEDDDDADAVPSFTLPLRKPAAQTVAFDEPEEGDNDDDMGDAGTAASDDTYSSLLAMRNPFAPKDHGFVRIDEPEAEADDVEPAVVFPGRGEVAAAAPATSVAAPRAFDPPGSLGDAEMRSRATPSDADAALRSALATLQRMSGTA